MMTDEMEEDTLHNEDAERPSTYLIVAGDSIIRTFVARSAADAKKLQATMGLIGILALVVD